MSEEGSSPEKAGKRRRRRKDDSLNFPLVPPRLCSVLRRSFGIKRLYNFQAKIQEFLLQSWAMPLGAAPHASDLRVYVPTGYGKTLSYIVPILTYILEHPQVVPGVKALILVPSRELALQTFQTFAPFIKRLIDSKKIYKARPQRYVAQSTLQGQTDESICDSLTDKTDGSDGENFRRRSVQPQLSICCLSGRVPADLEEVLLNGLFFKHKANTGDNNLTVRPQSNSDIEDFADFQNIERDHLGSQHGIAGPDILISVASRLANHVGPYSSSGLDSCDFTPLRFVVVDEADLLLSQSWQAVIDWESALQRITADKDQERLPPSKLSGCCVSDSQTKSQTRAIPKSLLALGNLPFGGTEYTAEDREIFLNATTRLDSSEQKLEDHLSQILENACRPISLHKLIFTATDVSDYKGMQELRLNRPLTIKGLLDEQVQRNLRQWTYAVGGTGSLRKAVGRVVAYFLLKGGLEAKVLVFCSSTGAVERYMTCLGALNEGQVICLSSTQSAVKRLKALEEFKSTQSRRVLVSTDLGCRGLDIDNVTAVIQVGLPHSAEVYIHRIGRTARNGRPGDAVLVYNKETSSRRFFNDLIHCANKFRICDLHPINGMVDNKID